MPKNKFAVGEKPARRISTEYYWKRKLVKTNTANNANRAILHAVDHLQFNHYEADSCVVYDNNNAMLHAVIGRSVATGKISILFKREVKENY